MNPVLSVREVFDRIQTAKAGAPAFVTNFFPVPSKLETWVADKDLRSITCDGVSLFLKKDRHFSRLYFCAASPAVLQQIAGSIPELQSEQVAVDVVGNESVVNDLVENLALAGFRTYARLQRMAGPGTPKSAADSPGRTAVARRDQTAATLALLETVFDPYSEQLPTAKEIESAIERQQILVAEIQDKIAGVLFFETQGFTSTLRFWAVSSAFRSLRVGSALMNQYFRLNSTTKRFTLWVNAANKDAIQKYRHYGYTPDGIVDSVLVNQRVGV